MDSNPLAGVPGCLLKCGGVVVEIKDYLLFALSLSPGVVSK